MYALALFLLAIASDFNGFLVGMAISGLGFGMYVAVDLALVTDVLPDKDNVAKDLGVMNIAGALPFSVAPAIAPLVLAIGGGSYGVLYAVAGVCAIVGACRHPAREAGPLDALARRCRRRGGLEALDDQVETPSDSSQKKIGATTAHHRRNRAR